MVDELKLVGQVCPIHAISDLNQVRISAVAYGLNPQIEISAYDVCSVRMGVVIHKQKFCIYGTAKQTYHLFQNDVPINVVCRGSDLEPYSGAEYNSISNV